MGFELQNISALVVVVAAASYLGLRAVRLLARKARGGCGEGCSGCCPQTPPAAKDGFVSVEELKRSRPGEVRSTSIR